MVGKKVLKDIAERVFWTAAEVAVGVLATETTALGTEWAVPIAAGLAVLKGFIATKVGNPNSAALTPAEH